MRARLEARLGGKRAVRGMTIGTFHAICLHLLGDVRLLAPGEALTLAADVLRDTGAKGSAKALVQAVSRVKNGASCAAAGLDEGLYAAYCARLKALGALESLQRHSGRLVGIISHVEELKEAIDRKIVVTASRSGSTLSLEL